MAKMNYSSNLQLTRFIAAVLVIVSHSFPLTQGSLEKEWLYILTNGQMTLGALSVATFFLCGGYLTAKSVQKYTSAIHYVTIRLKRLLPSLWFVVILCLLGGVFITTLSPIEYFTDAATYKYMLNGILILQHDLPGVFENAVYRPTINGALWTLPVELLCNIACYYYCGIRLFTRQKKRKVLLFILLIGCIFLFLLSHYSFIRTVLRPCLLFGIGMLYEMYSDKTVLKAQYAWIALAGLIISVVLGLLDMGMLVAFPYMMITLWFGGGGNTQVK